MRNTLFVIIVLFLIGLTSCEEQSLWKPLIVSEGLEDFNIINGTADYERDGNSIIGTTKLHTPNTFLATKIKYNDFELKFDVKLSEGLNSGVQIRSNCDSSYREGRVHGYQVEIEDSERGWAGGIYDEERRGWLYPLEWNAKGRQAFKNGEWNSYRIVANSDTIQTWVNGTPCANLIDDMTSEGFIAFQVHAIGDSTQANKTIEWKNIYIKTKHVGLESEGTGLTSSVPMTFIGNQEENINEFILDPNFTIKQIASEPLLRSPVAAELDIQGNLWAVELPGYMRDIDGSDEDKPDGRIVMLSDLDGDGKMDRRLVYKNNLRAPRALALIYNGLLYNDGRRLYFEDFETAKITIVDSNYVQGSNIEHQPNGLMFNIDNWIYSAKSNKRYQRLNGKWKVEETTLRGQWGISRDEIGRLVYNHNSDGLRGDKVLPNSVISNDYLRPDLLLSNQLCPDNRVYPYQETAVNRGYQDGVLDAENKLKSFTSACGPMIYNGMGKLKENAFACGPEANFVKRYAKEDETGEVFGQNYTQWGDNYEFLVSKNESFRPVNLIPHPRTGFLVLDFRKGIIQHRAYMTNYLREIILERGLDQINDKGRLYYISEKESTDKLKFSFWDKSASKIDIVRFLNHESGEIRLAAQKYILNSNDASFHTMIEKTMGQFSEFGKIHALRTLEGMGRLDGFIIRNHISSEDLVLSYHILNLYDQHPEMINEEVIEKIWAQGNPDLHLQLCHMLPSDDIYGKFVEMLILKYQNNATFSEALLSNVDLKLVEEIADPGSTIMKKLVKIQGNMESDTKVSPAIITNQYADARNEGFPAYSRYCSSCHGNDGRGQENLAPPILNSQYLEGSSAKLAALILQGIEGPITVNGTHYDLKLAMPGLKHNTDISDKEIASIIAFVNNAFSKSGEGVSPEKVKEIRKKLEGRTEMLTEDEVLNGDWD